MGVFTYVFTLVFVIGLAFVTTRYLSIVYTKGQQSRHIKVIEKINLAADKSLWLIEFAGKYYFLSSDRKGMNKIDAVDSLPDIPARIPPEKVLAESFSSVLARVRRKDSE